MPGNDLAWLEYVYYGVVGAACLIALSNWRRGMLVALVVEIIRDPIRKLPERQSVLITLAAAAVWGCVFLSLLGSRQKEMKSILIRYPHLKTGMILLVLALLPGAMIACISYPNGYRLAIIGGLSYLAPMIGIVIGYVFIDSEKWVQRFLATYVILNSIALVGAIFEYSDFDWPILRGLKSEMKENFQTNESAENSGKAFSWIRWHGTTRVRLISGFYRSPDVMGLHAAHVVLFSIVLAMSRNSNTRHFWNATMVWGAACLILCGRRKMMGMPFLFIAAFMTIGILRGSRQFSKLAAFAVIACLGGAGVYFAAADAAISSEYSEFASTMFADSGDRLGSIATSSLVTLNQSGFMGSGLGSATQGRQHLGGPVGNAWQEDGGSRLFKELGLPGVSLMVLCLFQLAVAVRQALSFIPPQHSAQTLQIGLLCLVIANMGSFAVSHQQYSGDPVNSLLVLVMLGAVFGAPRLIMTIRKPPPSVAPDLVAAPELESVHSVL